MMITKPVSSGDRFADVASFGVPEHHGDALPTLVQCGNLSFEIWPSGGCSLNIPIDACRIP
ncbi:MAG: hypothetical protein ACT4O2_09055 [Beijerinckiaceae bacterium]